MALRELLPGLWLGGAEDAAAFRGPRLCVHEAGRPYRSRRGDHAVPILRYSDDGEEHLVPDLRGLERAARWISARRKARQRCLVHCARGVERTPLAVAWWLAREEGCSVEDALGLVKRRAGPVGGRAPLWAGGLPPRPGRRRREPRRLTFVGSDRRPDGPGRRPQAGKRKQKTPPPHGRGA